MEWKELKNRIYSWDGLCRDIYVLNTNQTDWIKWIDYMNTYYRLAWYNGKADRNEHKIDISVVNECWSGNINLSSIAKVSIGKAQINTHFFSEQEIDNDIDPREFESIEDHNKLIDYMSGLSILLNKVVILTPENRRETVLIEVSGRQIKYY